MQSVSSIDTQAVEIEQPDGGIRRRVDYFGSPGRIDANPQAFLVERLYPGARIAPHFHDVDQFQIVVGGDCMMGKKSAAPVTFQYADAFTPYGPIVGVEKGFAFFTLRPVASGGFFAMPGNRHNMPGRAGRNIAGKFDLERPSPAPQAVEHETLMSAQDDGVNAVGIRLGPHAETAGPTSSSGGQYYVVCTGEVFEAGSGQALPRHSLIHVQAGDAPPVMRAGAAGADVLVLQFATPSDRPGSDPKLLAARDPEVYSQPPQGSQQ